MEKSKAAGIGFFEKYLTVWVALCMAAGVLIGKFLPGIPAFLGHFEYANVSIPIAVLIWLMIYPMMLKVDFQSKIQRAYLSHGRSTGSLSLLPCSALRGCFSL